MIRFSILSDSNSETGVTDANLKITSNKFYKFIEEQDYGVTLKKLAIVFMCRDPELNFNQRILHSKKDQALYFDIMLDYDQFVAMSIEQRVSEMCKKLLKEMPPIVKKYKFKDFDLEKLEKNLKQWFDEHHYIVSE